MTTTRINPIHATKPKKPLHFGDPNNPFTMCYKKRRRHSMNDAAMFEWTPPEGEAKKIMLCRHCREFVIATNPEGIAENTAEPSFASS